MCQVDLLAQADQAVEVPARRRVERLERRDLRRRDVVLFASASGQAPVSTLVDLYPPAVGVLAHLGDEAIELLHEPTHADLPRLQAVVG
jgi:hypothetical protein